MQFGGENSGKTVEAKRFVDLEIKFCFMHKSLKGSLVIK